MRTKTLLLLFLAGSLSLAFSSCGECSKKIDCPGFADDTLTALFPYSDNQQLVFRSDTNSTETFTLKNTRTTEPYQATGGGYGGPPRCNEEKVFESMEKDTAGRSLFAVFLLSGEYKSVSVNIKTSSISFNNFSDTAFSSVFINAQYAQPEFRSAVTIGGRMFTNVLVAQSDTTISKRSGVYRIFYTRAYGIVGYTNYPSGINWVKQ